MAPRRGDSGIQIVGRNSIPTVTSLNANESGRKSLVNAGRKSVGINVPGNGSSRPSSPSGASGLNSSNPGSPSAGPSPSDKISPFDGYPMIPGLHTKKTKATAGTNQALLLKEGV